MSANDGLKCCLCSSSQAGLVIWPIRLRLILLLVFKGALSSQLSAWTRPSLRAQRPATASCRAGGRHRCECGGRSAQPRET